MYALYIGRFQPFHLGHLDAIKQCLKKGQNLIIGVGSADDNWLPDNPFTAGERITMVKMALDEAEIDPAKYLIIPVWNINNYALWAQHTEILLPKFDKVYTGSEVVTELFKTYSSIEVKPIEFNVKIDATKIREFILQDDLESASQFLPKATTAFLKEINATQRMQIIKNLIRK